MSIHPRILLRRPVSALARSSRSCVPPNYVGTPASKIFSRNTTLLLQGSTRATPARNPSRIRTYATYRRFDNNQNSSSSSSSYSAFFHRLGFRQPPPRFVIYGLGACGVYYVAHLETIEETGRMRFMDTSLATERQLGEQAARQTLAQYSHKILPPSHPLSRKIQAISNKLLHASGLDNVKNQDNSIVNWKVHVIRDDNIKNAFVLPNGYIFVFTGILPVCKTDDGIAAVLGHEIAHQVARHSAERMSSLKVLTFLSIILETLGMDVGLSRLFVHLVLSLPNSRTAESEADRIGLKMMARACYNPNEAAAMWKRMQEIEGKSAASSLDFLSTHPANQKRITNITSWLPEARTEAEKASCGWQSGEFSAFKDSFIKPESSLFP